MRLLFVFVFLLGLVSCGEEKSSSSESSISSSDNYVFLKIKEGDDILVESDKANWFEDGVKGTTSNGYPKDDFKLNPNSEGFSSLNKTASSDGDESSGKPIG